MNFIKYVILLFTIHQWSVDAARILAIFSYTCRMQYEFVEPLLLELAQRGHTITAITNYPQNEKRENFRDIVIEENKHLFDDFKNYTMHQIDSNHYDVVHRIFNKAFEMCTNVMNHPLVVEMMRSESFDLIMLDIFFTESLFGFAQHFRAPIIGVSSFAPMISVDALVGNTIPLSYISVSYVNRPYKVNMNLWHRFLNVAMFVLEWTYYYCKYMPVHKKIYEHNFPNALLTFKEAQRNFSLVLVNDHFSLSTSRPNVPNMIEVAGMHIPTKSETLPSYINKLLNESTNGVVYVKTELFPSYYMEILLQQFRKLPQTVLWNLKTTLPFNMKIPDNVHVHTNLTHHSILSHPHIHLLICHGTYLQLVESVYYGVPILRLPSIHGDLENYVDFIQKIGNGLSLKSQDFNVISLSRALHDLLDVDRYRQEAKQLSQRFRDRQITPLETAIYWVEYVLRHNGAVHMRNLGQNLNTWQFYNLDVLVCLMFVTLCFVFLAYAIIKIVIYILRRFRIKTNVKTD